MTLTKLFDNLPEPTPDEPVVFTAEEPTDASDAYIVELEEALDGVLNANTLVSAKEIAADVLCVEVDEYLVQDVDDIMEDGYGEDTQEELDFNPDEEFKDRLKKWD